MSTILAKLGMDALGKVLGGVVNFGKEMIIGDNEQQQKQGAGSTAVGQAVERLVSDALKQSKGDALNPGRDMAAEAIEGGEADPMEGVDEEELMAQFLAQSQREGSTNQFPYISDEEWKEFGKLDPRKVAKAIVNLGPPYKGSEIELLHGLALENGADGSAYDNDDEWDDNTLAGYARFIRNSHYTYKPEAQAIDPEIDPNEEHIGPMAQQIEQVNPACIEETPEGVKTVDTGRLALMNAGAIGELARRVQDIAQKVGA